MYSDQVTKLLREGSKRFAAKEYEDASEKYAEACELYSNEHDGADDPDLLLLYGKSLFEGAVANSEVFGGQANDGDDENGADVDGVEVAEGDNFQFHDEAPLAEEDDASGEVEQSNKDEGEARDEVEDGAGDEEAPQSDFEVAWEILDLARALFEEKLAVVGPPQDLSPPYLALDSAQPEHEYGVLTKKLSETYDLLGEVSLESENFPQAALDLDKSLQLRQQLYDPSVSSLVSESHYKLSLALEFCVEDPELRDKAVSHLRKAIALVEARSDHETNEKQKRLDQDLVQDLRAKLEELERADDDADIDHEKLEILQGILGQPAAGAPGAKSTAVKVAQALKQKAPAVNDLSSMVKKRKPKDKGPQGAKRSKQ
jgi:HAT1-interacting factor 1